MKKTLLYFVPALAILTLIFSSCEKEPVVEEIQFTIDGYQVTFSATVKYADTYLWNFGDTKTSTEPAPVHEYLTSGVYTVTLTASGPGGESSANAQITISPSFAELLTGGAAASNGKTWVLSPAYTAGMDGASAIDNSMMVLLPAVENLLNAIGLPGEYDNEYTFYPDGRYVVDVKNGIALTASIYATVTGTVADSGNAENNLRIYGANFTAPASAAWTLHDGNLVLEAITNPLGTEVPAPRAVVTISGKKWISLSEGAFFGILDFPATRKFIIKEITKDKMHVALFVCGYEADETAWTIPAYLFHATYVPKK